MATNDGLAQGVMQMNAAVRIQTQDWFIPKHRFVLNVRMLAYRYPLVTATSRADANPEINQFGLQEKRSFLNQGQVAGISWQITERRNSSS